MFDSSSVWLKINYFRLTHVDDLRKWWVIVLLAIDIFILVFCLTNVALYVAGLSSSQRMIQAMANDVVDYSGIRATIAPTPLAVEATSLISVGDGTYDIVAKIKNLNQGWAVSSLSYTFSINNTETDEQTDFILPNSDKYLMVFGMTGPASASTARATLNIKGSTWQRVPNATQVTQPRFEISDISFTGVDTIGSRKVQRLSAQVKNFSYESFWQTKFSVVLLQGGKIVGATAIHFNPFNSDETKTLSAQITIAGLPDSAVIIPDVNFLDTSNNIK